MIGKSDLLSKELDQEIVEGLVSDEGLEVSEAEYWEHYYNRDDFSYEWNNGVLEVKPMADYQSSEAYKWFLMLLEEYLKYNPIAKSIYLDIGFRLSFAGQKVSIRKPDLALILESNTVDIAKTDSTFKGIYDVCIEFLSDSKKSEVERDTVTKKAEYGQSGVKEYYIIDRKGKETSFYYLSQRGQYLAIKSKDGVIKSTVLPGLQFRVIDLYRQPDLKSLIHDPVYQAYILLDYQKSLTETKQAKQQAEKAEQQAKQAEKQAKQAEQQAKQAEQQAEKAEKQAKQAEQQAKQADLRAEKLAKKLLELGIDPDSL